MNAGSPRDFSAHLSVARIHDKIKQMETPLYIMEIVDRLFFSLILIFLSTTFCKKTIISRNSLAAYTSQ